MTFGMADSEDGDRSTGDVCQCPTGTPTGETHGSRVGLFIAWSEATELSRSASL
jgi:hypothetical protein